MSKHGLEILEGVSVVWWFTLLFTICRLYASQWLRRVLFSLFFWLLEIKLKKGSLEHGITWFGRRFCCFVIYANLHILPCICIQNGSDGYFFFTFLWLLELKVKNGSLAHDKTLFGRRFCCLLIYATLHNLPCICIIMAPAGTFFTLLLVAGNKGEKRKLSTCQNMVWKAFLLFGDLRNSSQFAVYMHHNGSGGYFFSLFF